MSKNNITNLLNYLSLALVLSYSFFHNIFLVLIGITLALYEINKKLLYKIFKFDNSKKTVEKIIKTKSQVLSNSKNIELHKAKFKLSLVEEIEEFGFIPSLDKNSDTHVA